MMLVMSDTVGPPLFIVTHPPPASLLRLALYPLMLFVLQRGGQDEAIGR